MDVRRAASLTAESLMHGQRPLATPDAALRLGCREGRERDQVRPVAGASIDGYQMTCPYLTHLRRGRLSGRYSDEPRNPTYEHPPHAGHCGRAVRPL